jgi:DNA ligase 1
MAKNGLMLASAADFAKVRYPVLASPKLDGIRVSMINGVATTRSLKSIPNVHVQKLLKEACTSDQLDGELVVGPPGAEDCFRKTTSGVMSIDGEPDFSYWVFDVVGDEPFYKRVQLASALVRFSNTERGDNLLQLVPHVEIASEDDLLEYEAGSLAQGFEGVMIRDPMGPYKHGRSSVKEGWLLKVKRFVDSEAEIIGTTEAMQNVNEPTRNALGHLERSGHKAGKIGKGVMGSLLVRDLTTGVEFEIGTGFNFEDRAREWPLGTIVKYKSQPVGVKDRPRFPVYLGIRDVRDMS